MTTTSTHSTPPLEADWVERPLAITIEGKPVTGIARANWGAIEVAITSPITNLTRGRDGRGWCFAMLAHHRPQERFALGGEFTAKGMQAAERTLAEMYLDWLAVSRHEGEVDAACRLVRQELADIGVDFDARKRPLHEERSSLRRAFKAGELSQQRYQGLLKDLGKRLDGIEDARRTAEQAARMRFACRVEDGWGRKVSLDEAERLLTEIAVVVRAAATE